MKELKNTCEKTIFYPNLEVCSPAKNILKNFKYNSYEDRLHNLTESLNSFLDIRKTNLIGSAVYKLPRNIIDIDSSPDRKSFNLYPNFQGIYKLGLLEDYLGHIPINNQIEIKNKFESLEENDFLNYRFTLVILAPINNFAEEQNIKAIDPIVFAYYEEGTYSENKYLITLSQWI